MSFHWSSLLTNPAEAGQIWRRFCAIVENSYKEDERRVVPGLYLPVERTTAETKRRAQLLIKWFTVFRGDMNYSTQRSLDELPRVLRQELDGTGQRYEPSERAMWAGGEEKANEQS